MGADGVTGRRLATSLRLSTAAFALLAFEIAATLPSALAAAGDFDPSFATGGKFVDPLGEGTRPGASIAAVAIQPDGKIVATGTATLNQAVVVRLDPEGSLDQSFGAAGKLLATLEAGASGYPFPRAMALQADGKIVVAGSMPDSVAQESRLLVARVDAAGAMDSSFDGEGVVLTQVGGGPAPYSSVAALAVQPDGKILAAGIATDGDGRTAVLVVRLDTDGGFDPSFGISGKAIEQLGEGAPMFSSATALLLQPDGKILVGGGASVSDDPQDRAVLLARLNADGKSLDATFGDAGKVVTRLGTDVPLLTTLRTLAHQPDGKIVVGGYVLNEQNEQEFLVSRLNANGKGLDPAFASGGTLRVQLGGQAANRDSEVRKLVLQPDGKIVAVGLATGDGDSRALVARLRTDGTFDSAFGASGTVITQLAPVASYFNAAALQPDGKVVVGGDLLDEALDTHAVVARLILDQPPSAVFTATPNPAETGQPVAFADSGSADPEGAIASYAWDFGDGASATGASASHVYASAGTYTATLTVRDDYGLSATTSHTVDVAPSCGAERVPRPIRRGLARASASIDRAAATEKAERRVRLLARAGTALGKVSRAIDRVELRKRRPISATCAAALRRAVSAAAARIAALGS